jgi:branched-chain amino acid transport system substrate-binding protein
VRDVPGSDFDSRVAKLVSCEVTDATIDSLAVALQTSGADVLITAATAKIAAQTIRKIAGWKPLHFMTNVSTSVASVITPAGATNFHPIRQMQLTRRTRQHFELFGKVLQGEAM